MKAFCGLLIFFVNLNFCLGKESLVKPQSQVFKVALLNLEKNGISVSSMNRQFNITPDGFTILEDYSMYFKKKNFGFNSRGFADQTNVKVSHTNETLLTPKFEWKSTRLIEASAEKKTASITVTEKDLVLRTQVNAGPEKIEKISYKNKALPSIALPYFLFNQGRKQIGIPTDLDVFFEPQKKLKKISWVYLGTILENKKKIHRFEIKGGLSQMIQMDTEGRIVKIKDLKNFFELTSVR